MRMRRGTFLGVVGLTVGFLLVAYSAAPRVTGFSPNPDSPHVASLAPIRLQFNRAMDRVSVETRFGVSPEVPGRSSWEGDTLVFVPLEPWPAGQEIVVQLAAGSRSTRFLPMLRAFRGSFRTGEARLAYLWPADEPADLYLLTPDSGERVRLTQSEAGVLEYTPARDGSALVYAALRTDGTSELRRLDLITQEDRVVLECPAGSRCQAPALSPEGDLLAYEQFEWQTSDSGGRVPGPRQVWLLSLAEGAEPVQVPPPGQVTSSPIWSPNGLLSFYNGSLRAVGLVRPESLVPISMIPNGLGLLGAWSPNGEYLLLPEIVFEDAQPTGQASAFSSHLFRVEPETAIREDFSLGSVEDASPAYSPDGEWIAFGRKYLDERWTPGRQLWLMRSDGSEPRPLTDEPDFNHSSISWNPDSGSLAFMRASSVDPNLPSEIWVTDLAGSASLLLAEGGYLPKWIP